MKQNYPFKKLNCCLNVDGFCVIKYQEKPSGYCFPGETHEVFELIYADKGYFYLLLDEKGYKVNQGDLFFFGRNQNHILWSDSNVAPAFITISFQMSFDKEAYFEQKRFLINRDIQQLLQRILDEYGKYIDSNDPVAEQLLRLSIEELMLRLYRLDLTHQSDATSSPIVIRKSENMMIQRCVEFIESNLYRQLPISEIAGVIPLSISSIAKLFQSKFHCSVGEYVITARLTRAKQLILKGELTMTRIAEETGFSTVHYFSRLFRKRFGVSPTEYAKINQRK